MGEKTEEKVDFVAATMHELKTSLTAIIVSAELLAAEIHPDENEAQGRLIQSITRNAHSINERLSRFSEIGSMLLNNLRLHLEPVEIGVIIRDVTTQLYPLVKSKKQSLTMEVPDFLPLVRADKQYLEQVLLTLVANASKFTPEEGKIKVSARQDDGSVVVQVSDTGIGIPTEESERIFQPYYQVNQGDGRKLSGSGLGLAITKSLVKSHNGKLWLESDIGRGSSFFLSLPGVESK